MTAVADDVPAWRATEEWAVLFENGAFHTVDGDSRANAERDLALLRAGADGYQPEPYARLVTRLRAVHLATGREQVAAWVHHPTPGDVPNPVPAFLRHGATC
jgi:hypothetical protein